MILFGGYYWNISHYGKYNWIFVIPRFTIQILPKDYSKTAGEAETVKCYHEGKIGKCLRLVKTIKFKKFRISIIRRMHNS